MWFPSTRLLSLRYLKYISYIKCPWMVQKMCAITFFRKISDPTNSDHYSQAIPLKDVRRLNHWNVWVFTRFGLCWIKHYKIHAIHCGILDTSNKDCTTNPRHMWWCPVICYITWTSPPTFPVTLQWLAVLGPELWNVPMKTGSEQLKGGLANRV